MMHAAKTHCAFLIAGVFMFGPGALPRAASGEPVETAQPDPATPDGERGEEGGEEGQRDEIEVIRILGDSTGALPREASSFSTEIDLEQFSGEQKRLEDLLAQTVGVQVRRFGGPGERAEISIRGFSSTQVVVLLDGVKLNG
ncbi:MAG: TonB-dependent receptor plug domain-containing protein, partial [Deltaproteobacteria bacterium]|nr:TonB-dependent receptor plug domain-containing protein [Deltaproteobacteria bacterium]